MSDDQISTRRVLTLVGPQSERAFASPYEPGNMVTFWSRAVGAVAEAEGSDQMLLQFSWQQWTDLGRPDHISVAVLPGVVSVDSVLASTFDPA